MPYGTDELLSNILQKNNVFAPTNPVGGPVTTNRTSPTSIPPTSNDSAQGWGDLSSVLGGFSSGQKANRALEGQFTQNYDRLMLDAAGNRRTDESDALRKLNQTAYIAQGGSHFAPGSLSLNGKTYQQPDNGSGPIAPSAAERVGANNLKNTMLARLKPGGSYTPTALDTYAKPGMMEKLSSYGATAAGLGGLANKLGIFGGGEAGGQAGAGTVMSSLLGGGGNAGEAGGLSGFLGSNAVPLAGAAAGAYGVARNDRKASTIGSGALSGASIGSMVAPGIGTAVGAGIGALAGGLRHAFGGPDGLEKAGRSATDDIFGQLGSQATPAEQTQAQSAGWANPGEALAYIVMGDKLRAAGQDPSLADQYMKQLHDAQKHGAGSVTQAASPIQTMMAGRG